MLMANLILKEEDFWRTLAEEVENEEYMDKGNAYHLVGWTSEALGQRLLRHISEEWK